jgi:hypothetical protein
MAAGRIEIAALLAREYPFQNYSREQLLAIADRFSPETHPDGAVIASSKQPLKRFVMVFSGKVELQITAPGGKILRKLLNPGDYFGEDWLFLGHSSLASARIVGETVLLVLDANQFSALLAEYPELKTTLQNILNSRRMARSNRFNWVQPDEVVFLITRRHWIFLIRGLLIPIMLLVISLPLIAVAVTQGSENPVGVILLCMSLGLGIIGLGGFIWAWLDWGNDYFVVTSQRVVFLEKIILFYDSRDEAPLYTILAVDIFSTFLGQLFGYGNVSARTFTGMISMNQTSQPYLLAAYIDGLRRRAEEEFRQREEAKIQEILAAALRKRQSQAPEELIPSLAGERPVPKPKKKKKTARQPQSLRARLDNFLKLRFEQGGTVTYRKSIPILLWKTGLPLLSVSLLFLIFFVQVIFDPLGLPVPLFLILWLVMFAVFGFWLWYQYTDWKNDIYRITESQIFDIEKKPIGPEMKKSADIEDILTITHRRTFLGILLNFGNVFITVGNTEFIFLDVYNPDRVHQEIANKQEALRQRKRLIQEARERERMVNWLVAYNKEAKKLE